jgi:hypothetical protein
MNSGKEEQTSLERVLLEVAFFSSQPRAFGLPRSCREECNQKENSMTNRERLEQVGLVDPDAALSQEQEDAIERLTSEEVDALISVKAKLGPVFQGQSVGIRCGLLIDQ